MNSLLLASSSPRRSDFLKQCHFNFSTFSSDVDETIETNQTLEEAVCQLALRKATYAADLYADHVVLGADTIVSYDGIHLGKPQTKEDARAMLTALSGKTHFVSTGVAIVHKQKKVVFSETTCVTMTEITEEQLDAYLQTDEPFDKAGGYGIQSLGAMFVSHINGDFYTVAGLPLARTVKELASFHIYPQIKPN
ncbi:septum formation protein Maf [Bacillus sp. JCM 19046]|nr:septum formation protein Maf [Bacillus sp. JCM 19045]GAF19685.1 septum formation protein Maf [Bacillus sp. JCM 19046]